MSKEEKFIGVFFNGVMAYLEHIPNMDTEVGTPYLIQSFSIAYSYANGWY